MKLEKTMSMSKLAESIFDYEDKYGNNCMLISFDMIANYFNETGNFADSGIPMYNEIESNILYLIKLAEANKLNMKKILNWTADDGMTLFWRAAFYSESLAIELLKKNVDVKTVDDLFQTPAFRVS